MVKNWLSMEEMQGLTLGQEDPLEKGMATTPVFLPGEFHGWSLFMWKSHSLMHDYFPVITTEPASLLTVKAAYYR